MSVIYGYVGKAIPGHTLRDFLLITEARGRYAFGVTFLKGGARVTLKNPGRLTRQRSLFNKVVGANCIIGVSLVSCDANAVPENSPPFTYGDDVSVIHVSEIHSYQNLYPRGQVIRPIDTLVASLWQSKDETGVNPLQRHKTLPPHTILAINGKCLLVMNKQMPFFVEETAGGIFFCSRMISNKSKQLNLTNLSYETC